MTRQYRDIQTAYLTILTSKHTSFGGESPVVFLHYLAPGKAAKDLSHLVTEPYPKRIQISLPLTYSLSNLGNSTSC